MNVYFLIDYDRSKGRIVKLQKFKVAERAKAEAARLVLELQLHRQGIEREIVLLEAPSERDLRKTHGRYFEDVAGLAKQLVKAAQKSGRVATRRGTPRAPRRSATGTSRRRRS